MGSSKISLAAGESGQRGARGVAHQLAQALFELVIASAVRFPAVASEFSLSSAQAGVVIKMDPEQNHMMRAVAEAVHCEPSNLTGIVDKLEDRGLVERREGATDRRIKMISLTREGEALRRKLISRLSEPADWMLALPASDQRRLRDIFRRAIVTYQTPKRIASGS